MKKLSFLPLILLLLIPFDNVEAADTTSFFTATAPTMYEDGTLFDPGEVISYFMYCGTTPGTYNVAINITDQIVNGGENVVVGLCVTTPGTYYFVATAFSFLYNTESVFSNETSRSYIAADFEHIPMAPEILFVAP